MRSTSRRWIVAAMSLVVLSTATARTGRNSFLEKPANSTQELVRQAMADNRVADRYMRHFGMSKNELKRYLSSLKLAKLPKDNVYIMYNVPNSGELRGRAYVLKKGTPVFVDEYNMAILKKSCGNPLTRGPKVVVSLPDVQELAVDDVPTLKVLLEEDIAKNPADDGTLVLLDDKMAFEPGIGEAAEPFTVVVEPMEPQIGTTPPTLFPEVLPGPALPPLLPFFALLPPILLGLPRDGSPPPPPVPEPATIAVFGAGAAILAARRKAKK
ncbi:MAG: hypothetical protein HONBIEJF_00484 [Fimbriimonadaceae bacterium]|nr:hypothetical protein [Fimbriimonadaceae bacterium]